MSNEVKLRLSETVPILTETFQEYTPEAGKEIDIITFKAEANYTVNSSTKIVWDYGGPNEEVLWSIKGSGSFEEGITISPEDVDGVKKIALVLYNGEDLSIDMAGFVKFRIR